MGTPFSQDSLTCVSHHTMSHHHHTMSHHHHHHAVLAGFLDLAQSDELDDGGGHAREQVKSQPVARVVRRHKSQFVVIHSCLGSWAEFAV